jgi:hypothetical protein
MCTGIEIAALASAAVAAAGSGVSAMEQSKNANAMARARNEATEATFKKIGDRRQEAEEIFGYAVPGASRGQQEADRGQATRGREQAVAENVASQPGSYKLPSSQSGPAVVQNEAARRSGQAQAKAQRRGAAQGALSGYGDALNRTGIRLTRSRDMLGDIGAAARGTAGLLELEQNAAMNNANEGTSGFGDFLQLAGSTGNLAASSGQLDGLFGPATVGTDQFGNRVRLPVRKPQPYMAG